MIACCDVDYHDPGAVAAGLWFDHWSDSTGKAEVVLPIAEVAPYQSGQFYLRELPCLLAVLEKGPPADLVVLDGYVWLGDGQPGLGAHLYRALNEKVTVIGVAKTRYAGVTLVRELRRRDSANPLYITAAGIDLSEAARHIAEMHGPYRIPTLLKKVDQLCRGRA
ncbi:MAG TPA: endonuclease V [Thermoanaerobaculia bacterium]|nr:endonuclease V [Thermoanaerobaculia bacterium]